MPRSVFCILVLTFLLQCTENSQLQDMWWQSDGPWEMIGGWGVNQSWGTQVDRIRKMDIYQGRACAAMGSYTVISAEVWCFDGSAWEQIGGRGIKGSWNAGQYRGALTLVSRGTYLYVGLGDHLGDANVWQFNGNTWEHIGGNGIKSSWPAGQHDEVWSMTIYNNELYVGINSEEIGHNEALIYKYNENADTWTYLTGRNSENSGWSSSAGYFSPYKLYSDGNYLYVGMAGRSNNSADVWRYDGNNFLLIGGHGINSSWNVIDAKFVYDLIKFNGKLIASVTGDPQPIWQFDGTTWSALGDVPGEFVTNSTLNTLFVYNNQLYVTAGGGPASGSVWVLENNTTWKMLGGYGLDGSVWNKTPHLDQPSAMQWMYSFVEFQGKMLIGLASEPPGGGQVWRLK